MSTCPEGAPSRVLACAILTIGTMVVAAPARAQTYDPNYPVCLETYGIDGGHTDCSFTSLAQCAASANRAGRHQVEPIGDKPRSVESRCVNRLSVMSGMAIHRCPRCAGA